MTEEPSSEPSARHEQNKIKLSTIYSLATTKWGSFPVGERQAALSEVGNFSFNQLCQNIYSDLDSRSMSEFQDYFEHLSQDANVKNALAAGLQQTHIYLAFALVMVTEAKARYHIY